MRIENNFALPSKWFYVTFFCTVSAFAFRNASGQISMIPIPIGKSIMKSGVKSRGPIAPEKILILEDVQKGKKDTVYAGDYIKIWVKSENRSRRIQPLSRVDFDNRTKFYESFIFTITDTSIIMARSQVSPLPITLPRKKVLMDTILIKEVRRYRVFSKSSQMTISNTLTATPLAFLPEYFTTFPGMLYMMPANSIVMNFAGGSLYPMKKIISKQSRFKMIVAEKPADSLSKVLSASIATSSAPYTWEIEKELHSEKKKATIRKMFTDQAINDNTGNRVSSISIGNMFYPGYIKGPKDQKTNVDITDKGLVIGLSSEMYINHKHRIGFELQAGPTSRALNMSGAKVAVGFGYIFANSSYMKFGLGSLYNKKLRSRLYNNWASLNPGPTDADAVSNRNFQRMKMISAPQAYLIFGGGAVNTTLLRIRGSAISMSDMSTTEYTQKKFFLQTGLGFSSRLSSRFLCDMSVKYLWSDKYSPSIGGVNSYSGIKLQVNIGYVTGPSFAKMRSLIKNL